MEKQLPNGWEYGLSNEIYETMDGTNYENIGIPPHHEIEYAKRGFYFIDGLRNDLAEGKGDTAVEKALELIKK